MVVLPNVTAKAKMASRASWQEVSHRTTGVGPPPNADELGGPLRHDTASLSENLPAHFARAKVSGVDIDVDLAGREQPHRLITTKRCAQRPWGAGESGQEDSALM